MTIITADRLRHVLHYNPLTGIFTRKIQTSHNALIGAVAGSLKSSGYWGIYIDNHHYRAHRLAWLYVTGMWPNDQIDHINLNKSDNRIANLREATSFQNGGNTRAHKTNTSGIKGVYWYHRLSKWHAQIRINGRRNHLGYFDNIEDAAFAYRKAAHEHFGEFARTS